MDEASFREVVTRLLLPMLGASLEDAAPSSSAEKEVAWVTNQQKIGIKPRRDADFRLILSRSQPFTNDEKRLAVAFQSELKGVQDQSGKHYFESLLESLPRWIISTYIDSKGSLRTVLERLEGWAARTYEGGRISAAILLRPDDAGSGIPLAEYWEQAFAPVLTNGYDTIIEVGADSEILGVKSLQAVDQVQYCPFRFGQIAWAADDGSVAVVLNYHGEILVFAERALRFAKRDGRWIHYGHDQIIRSMSPPGPTELKQAIYESCLDVSFSRSGGCLSVIAAKSAGKFKNDEVVAGDDRIDLGRSYKARMFKGIVGNRSFAKLDRRLRQELLGLDGAVVLTHDGILLAAGAIVQVPGGSTGGGRLAAAKQLSQYGLGVKISEDGPVQGFSRGEERFRISGPSR